MGGGYKALRYSRHTRARDHTRGKGELQEERGETECPGGVSKETEGSSLHSRGSLNPRISTLQRMDERGDRASGVRLYLC